MSIADQIKSATDKIIHSDNFGDWKTGADELYDFFSVKAGVYAEDLSHESFKKAHSGVFVSQIMAAHCVKDFMRTSRFIRGLYQAIQDQLAKKDSVHILYAGCGPYATLFTPMTTLFSPAQVKVTLFEIGQVPLASVEKMYNQLELTDYVKAFVNGDGTDPDVALEGPFDIIISETMQAGLKKECQVPLTRNLVKFLAKEGTFIPQKINVEAVLEQPKMQDQPAEKLVGSIYELDYRNVPEKNYQTELDLPSDLYQFLMMKTSIQVYNEEWLNSSESGITTKLIMDHLEVPRNKAQFMYQEEPENGEEIGFEIVYTD